MRVHHLAMTAFGPFAETVEVDFDDLGRDGLFLLWGPTGSGKTTVLDAIVFALYGTVPGARGLGRQLRSDHAAADVRTGVRLEVTIGGDRLLVVRRPEQDRPKRRGAGSTTDHASLSVQRLADGLWEPVSHRIDEGSDHLRSRLGLSAEQFCQVVLLPQGEFARFLRAGPEDRAGLLRALFDVGQFARAEEWLVQQRREHDELARAAHDELRSSLTRVSQVAAVGLPDGVLPELAGAGASSAQVWVDALRASARSAGAAAVAAVADTDQLLTARGAQLVEARSIAERHARRDRAAAELVRLQVAEPASAVSRDRLEAARRAEPLRELLAAATRASQTLQSTLDAAHGARARWQRSGGAAPATREVAADLQVEIGTAQALLPQVPRLEELVRTEEALTRSLEDLSSRMTAADAAVADAPAQLDLARADVVAAEAAEAVEPAVRGDSLRAREVATAAGLVPGARAALAAAEAAVLDAREALVDAREHVLTLRSARLAGIAAELATGLVAGTACAVCGSPDHPRPARSRGAPVSPQDEELARAAVETAERTLSDGEGWRERRAAELAAAEAVAGDVDVAGAEREVRAAADEHRRVLALLDGLPAARSRAELLAVEVDRVRERRGIIQAELAGVRARLMGCTAARTELEVTLRQAAGHDADLQARLRRLATARAHCEEVVRADEEVVRAEREHARAGSCVASAAGAAGFTDGAGAPDLTRAVEALLGPRERRALEEGVVRHRRSVDVARAVLDEPELSVLPPAVDVAAADHAWRAARVAHEGAIVQADAAVRLAGELDRLAGDVTAATVEFHERAARADHIASIADLVAGRGANRRRMRLESFVLAARLEQVAEVSSRRLQDMSAGRFTFRHSPERGRNGGRGGLGLDVLDEYTGTTRPTRTLSGGEGFMAALALALGLADVVTAENGGVQLDTLFIDEGFGTLDARSLDSVLGVLDELRRGGRAVGVISHVEEVRARIPACLQVVTGRQGSRLVC